MIDDTVVLIRPIRPDDGPAWADLVSTVYAETDFMATEPDELRWLGEPVADIERRLKAGGTVLVAEEDGRLVGEVTVSRGAHARNRGVANLGIVIRQSHVGRGLGRRLMQAAEDWARAQGCHRIELGVMGSNPRAQALYRKLGYVEEGRSPGLFRIAGQDVDDILMAKLLLPEPLPVWTPPDLAPVEREADAGQVSIRRLRPDDAPAWLAYQRQVRAETPFLTRSADELAPDLDAATARVAELAANPLGIALVATAADGRIVGHAGAEHFHLRRLAHNAELHLGVLSAYAGAGLGSRFVAEIEAWARAKGVTRLMLHALAGNDRAIRLYDRLGFVREYRLRAGAVIDGRYADRLGMTKRL